MWQKFYKSFHDSEVILWARIQVFLGIGYAGLSMVDPMMLNLPPRAVAAWVFANGALAEYLRRRRAEYDTDGDVK